MTSYCQRYSYPCCPNYSTHVVSIDISSIPLGSITEPSRFAHSIAIHRSNYLLPSDRPSIHGLYEKAVDNVSMSCVLCSSRHQPIKSASLLTRNLICGEHRHEQGYSQLFLRWLSDVVPG
jgi:hypothetical protein